MKNIFTGFLCFMVSISFSQTAEDAINYGFDDLVGSGRYIGMGGAFLAVGGDLSSIKDNPAAGGLKRKDEWSVTGAMSLYDFNTNANGEDSKDNLSRFSLPDLNYLTVNKTKDRYWKHVNFSIGINRTNNLNSSVYMTGRRVEHSYLSTLRDQANELKGPGNTLPDNTWANFAYQSYLLNINPKGYVAPLETDQLDYIFEYNQTGRIYDINFSVSASYKDKLFLGGSLSFPVLNAESYSRLSEIYANPKQDWMIDSLTITSVTAAHFETKHNLSGSGVNAKLGLIYKLDKSFRIGLSLHTPTYFNIEDVFSYKVTGNFADIAPRAHDYLGTAYYDLVIPAKYNVGMAYVFGKKGLISMDYSFRDFSSTKYVVPNFDPNYDYFNGGNIDNSEGVNDILSSAFGSAHTIKIGAEYNIKPFRLRAGYVQQNSPYNASEDLKSTIYSGGIGFSRKEFTCDLAYSYALSENSMDLSPYRETDKGKGQIENTIQQFVLTFGFRIK